MSDPSVAAVVEAAFKATGRTGFVPDPPPLPFATDFGNISRASNLRAIGVDAKAGGRSIRRQGVAQFASEDGVDAALTSAEGARSPPPG